MKQILALDLGTDTGWALGSAVDNLTAGTWNLGTAKEIAEWGKTRIRRRRDPRITKFFHTLRLLSPEIIVFEDVLFASSTYAVQLWSSFRGALWCAFPESTIFECVPTGTLKKFATGHGAATKQMMESRIYLLHPKWKNANLSDDAIDSLWLWYWAAKHLAHV